MEVIVYDKIEVRNPSIIIGFGGVGLVSNVASQFIVHELSAQVKGTIISGKLPPVCLFFDGKLEFPIRIYECTEPNEMLIFVSDIPVNVIVQFEFAKAIVDWIKSSTFNCKEIITTSEVLVDKEYDKIFYGVNRFFDEKKLRNMGMLQPFNSGSLAGLSCSIMSLADIGYLPCMIAIIPCSDYDFDIFASAMFLRFVSKYFGVNLDIDKFIKEGEKVYDEIFKVKKSTREKVELMKKDTFEKLYG